MYGASAIGSVAGPACTIGSAKANGGLLRVLGVQTDGALDLKCEQVGSGLVDGLLERVLERRCGRGTAVAAALQAQTRDAVFDAQDLDAATMRREERLDALYCFGDTLFERHRIQAVDQQQAGDDSVIEQCVADVDSAFPGVSDDAEDALQTSSVQLENRADQLLHARLRDRVGDFVERAQEILDPLDQLFRSCVLSCHLGSQHIPVGVC